MQAFFPTYISSGKMTNFNRDAFGQFISRLKNGKYILVIEKDHPRRTSPENRYYWGVVLKLIAEHTGYSTEECHAIFKDKFLSYEKFHRRFSRSTTKLKTVEFEEYLENIRRFAATDLQVYVPEPNQ